MGMERVGRHRCHFIFEGPTEEYLAGILVWVLPAPDLFLLSSTFSGRVKRNWLLGLFFRFFFLQGPRLVRCHSVLSRNKIIFHALDEGQ